MKRPCLLATLMLAASVAQAGPITSFVNLDFDAGLGMSFPFNGFDQAGYDVPGWTNANGGTLVDAGVEGPGAWWGTYQQNAAFMSSGDAAFTMSSHTIQAGDLYQISFFAQHWQWLGTGQWTATLFYNTPANVIGSFVQGSLPQLGGWAQFTSPVIAATPASVGGTLGILMTSTGTAISNVDEIVVNLVPEPATFGLAGVCGAALLAFRRRAVC